MNSEETRPIRANTELKAYADPMDFITKNLAAVKQANAGHPATQVSQEPVLPEPQAVADTVKQRLDSASSNTQPAKVQSTQGSQEAQGTEIPAQGSTQKEGEVEFDLDPQDGTKPTETPAVEAQETDEGSTEEGDSKEINFKKVRTKLSETTKTLKEKETEITDLKSKIEAFKTGVEQPEVIKQKDDEIARLSRFEQIHSLKTSPAYLEAFVKPIDEATAQIRAIAKDYGYPEGVIEKAVNISNKAELNRFLASHFDEVGALEVKSIITRVQDVRAQAIQAEQEPVQALARIQAEHTQAIEAERAREKASIAEASKRAWVDGILAIRAEGKVQELIPREGDTEHNEKFVKPILQAAATEYGKLIRVLADSGLKALNQDAAKQLAMICQRAAASGTAFASRDALMKELEGYGAGANARKYGRPSLGGGQRASAPAPTSLREEASKRSLRDTGQMLIDMVNGK